MSENMHMFAYVQGSGAAATSSRLSGACKVPVKIPSSKQAWCVVCASDNFGTRERGHKTLFWCENCQVALCRHDRDCFKRYHSGEILQGIDTAQKRMPRGQGSGKGKKKQD
jgi:hypothetical protein